MPHHASRPCLRLARLVAALVLLSFCPSAQAAGFQCPDLSGTAWANATQRDPTGAPLTRFIPPELYSGAPWDGDRELVLRPMDVTRTPETPPDHPAITIRGPMPSTTSPDIMVLTRRRESRRQGVVAQEFVINERGDGLGRLGDNRWRKERLAECFKFPVGLWRQGEERRCRESVIRILELDYTYGCVPHSLKFRWNGEGTYIFSPGRGLVSVTH